MKKILKNNDGIALVMVILLLALVGSLATAMMLMYSSNIDLVQDATARSQAFYAAEGGVNYLDLKLNDFYQEKIAGKSFFSAEKIYEKLQDLESQFEDELNIAGYDITIAFNPHPNYEETNSYIYEVTADNGNESETIKVEYLIEHLVDYFKYSRFANKINIENSEFGYEGVWFWRRFDIDNIDDHSFGTSELLYTKWSKDNSYYQGEYVVHSNKLYTAKNNFNTNETIEPGSEGSDSYWNINQSIFSWDSNENYDANKKVIYNNEVYTSQINDNSSTPGTNNHWIINDPDLANQRFAQESNEKVDYNQIALPSTEDDYYQEKIVDQFKERVDENGYTYQDDNGSYPDWNGGQYRENDKVTHNGKVYRSKRRSSRNNPHPEPGEENNNWENYWTEQNAGQEFIDNYNYYLRDENYIYIDGDLTTTIDSSIEFDKDDDEVIHILVDGVISPKANISFGGNANIIIYTTSKTVSFKDGHITFNSSGINLAYFAPLATFESVGFTGGYASSMLFNEINLIDQDITTVKTYGEDNPLRGGIDPGIAELTRIHGDPDYESDKTKPIRLDWSVIR